MKIICENNNKNSGNNNKNNKNGNSENNKNNNTINKNNNNNNNHIINENNIKILDASAIIHGYNPLLEEGIHYITYGIYNEVITKEDIVDLSVQCGKLKIREPKKETLNLVSNQAIKTGDTLSKNDIEILALAYDLKGILYTDDYGLQNVSQSLGVPTKCIISDGIKDRFLWKLVCKGCKKMYNIDYKYDVCEVCGCILERKMVRNKSRKYDKKHRKNKKKK